MDLGAAKDTVDSINMLTSKLRDSIVPLLVNHASRLCTLDLGDGVALSDAAEALATRKPGTGLADDEWAFILLCMTAKHAVALEAELAKTGTSTDKWFDAGQLRVVCPLVPVGSGSSEGSLPLETALLIGKIVLVEYSAIQMKRFAGTSDQSSSAIIRAKWKLCQAFEQVCADAPCPFKPNKSPLPMCFGNVLSGAITIAKEFKAAVQHAASEAARSSTIAAFVQAQSLQIETKVDCVVVALRMK